MEGKHLRVFVVSVFLLPAVVSHASSCVIPKDLDPYLVIDEIYDRSDAVFIGKEPPRKEAVFLTDVTRPDELNLRAVEVQAMWKGPHADMLWVGRRREYSGLLEFPYEIYFAMPAEGGKGWAADSGRCLRALFKGTNDTVPEYLVRTYGVPMRPDPGRSDIPAALLIAGIFLGSGGLSFFSWTLAKV